VSRSAEPSSDRRKRGLLAVWLIASVLGIALYATSAVDRLENDSVDARFSIRGEREAPREVAVVGIDAADFRRLDTRWPFPRSLHGELINRLVADGVRSIVYDVQFTEPTVPREDNALILAIARAGESGVPVTLVTEEVDRSGRTGVLGGEAVLGQVGARAAHGGYEPDAGGIWRRYQGEIDGLETLAVAAVEQRSGEQVDLGGFGGDGAYIDYAGPPRTLDTYPFTDVLDDRVGRDQLAGRTVVVGATAPVLQDVHAVPTSADSLMPGAEVQANAIQTVLDDLPLADAPWPVGVLLVLGLAGVSPLVGSRRGAITALLATVGATFAYLVICQLAFGGGLVLPIVAPSIAAAIAVVGTLAVHYTLEAFERQRVRDTFARFVPAGVVGEVLERAGSDLRLGAERRECTVMFSDLRGFTTFAESREPSEVVAILNRYLGAMTDAIMDHGGSIVSYMGDGIMAVFGAPLDQTDHADRALAAAREMLGPRMRDFNAWAESEEGAEPFRMGIGLNTGPVMAGQVGSEQRVEFAAIGDTTNTAARLEAMTKQSDHDLFISDTTKQALSGEPGLEFVEEMEVRGRSGKVAIWTIGAN